MSTVMSIIQSPSTGHIWVGVYNGGAFEIDKSAPVGKRVKYYSPSNVPWMCNSCIYSRYSGWGVYAYCRWDSCAD